ncbi:hypothetical protein [Streptomyces sp. NPDC093589]|uniref:hypothetical protein n=1 Tax=Streptomyces sp. NPDC093589 TaxID=3366043 RepID=UPI003821B790
MTVDQMRATTKQPNPTVGSVFKPAHIKRHLKQRSKMRVSRGAVICMDAVLTYLTMEIVEAGDGVAKEEGKKKLLPKHLNAAIHKDAELSGLLTGWAVSSGSAVPSPQPALIKRLAGQKQTVQRMKAQGHQYRSSVKRAARKCGPGEVVLSASALEVMTDIVVHLLDELGDAAANLASKVDKETIGSDDVVAASELVLTGELRQHALAASKNALAKATPRRAAA